MFPFEAMPTAAQYIAEIPPATILCCVRAVVLRSASLTDLSFDLGWLLLFCLGGL